MTCNCNTDCCEDQPINAIQQAVNDAMADRFTELQGYVDSSKENADASAVSETNAAESATEAKDYRDQTEAIYQDAQELVPKILESASDIQTIYDVVTELSESVKSDLTNMAFVNHVFNDGSAVGGETEIALDASIVFVPEVIVNGSTQTPNYGYTFDITTHTLRLASALKPGDFLVYKTASLVAIPDLSSYASEIQWLYQDGSATGGETSVELPYTITGIPLVFINGSCQIPTKNFTIDQGTSSITITLGAALKAEDALFVVLRLPN